MRAKAADLVGKAFGSLTVVSRAEPMNRKSRYVCRCDCGQTTTCWAFNLTTGHTKSCGCQKAVKRTHGLSGTPIYLVWRAMIDRCNNPKSKSYPIYGGRGIQVCEQWRTSFVTFLNDMGRPEPGMELDRIDNDGPYSPQNCRWVPRKVNTRNRRTNHLLTHDGLTLSIAEWAERLGVNHNTIMSRVLRGWPTHRILTTPPRKLRFHPQWKAVRS